MKTVRVSRKYQITIPKEIREKIGIKIGDRLLVRLEDKRIIFEPIIEKKRDPVKHMLNLIKKPQDIDAVRLVEESWDED